MKNLKILDKYIFKQLFEVFIVGIVMFTTIMFASDSFLYLVKQVTSHGIPFKVAMLAIILKIPSLIVVTIPMGVLLATIVTFNRLSLNSELTCIRACGISLARTSFPVLIFGIIAGCSSFFINEFVVPAANKQAKLLTVWALGQKNIPEGKHNFSIKELNQNNNLKRLFYIDQCKKKQLEGITVLDLSKPDTIQVIQSKYGNTSPESWSFQNGAIYTISDKKNLLNTTVFDNLELFSNMDLSRVKKVRAQDFNFFELTDFINKQKQKGNEYRKKLDVLLHEKIALPFTAILIAIIGVPLAITPPRTRFNRGILFSILLIFCYYLIRAFSISLGETHVLIPIFSAWLPNIIIFTLGILLFYRKNCKI